MVAEADARVEQTPVSPRVASVLPFGIDIPAASSSPEMTVAPAPAPEAAGPSLRLTEQDEGTMPGLGAHEGIGFNTSPPSRVIASEDPKAICMLQRMQA